MFIKCVGISEYMYGRHTEGRREGEGSGYFLFLSIN